MEPNEVQFEPGSRYGERRSRGRGGRIYLLEGCLRVELEGSDRRLIWLAGDVLTRTRP